MLEPRPMEVIKHNLECNCNRRREWIEIDGEFHPIEFSVDDPNEPPMSEEQKAKIAEMLKQHLATETISGDMKIK